MRHLGYLYRLFLKNRFTNLLGISGLSVGIALSVLMLCWTYNELTYDEFNRDYKKIHRLIFGGVANGQYIKGSGLNLPLFKACLQKFPEIESGTIVNPEYWGDVEVKVNDELFFVSHASFVDSNFFDFFDYSLINGTTHTVLDAPDKIVITEKLAIQLFNNSNPIGESLSFFGQNWQVGGVMDAMPANSHLHSDMLIPYRGLDWFDKDSDFILYFKISETSDVDLLAEKIGSLRTGGRYEELGIDYELQSLKEVRFSTDITSDFITRKIEKHTVLIVAVLSVLILILACVNFVNLFISTMFVRAKSIYLRKIHGANRVAIALEIIAEIMGYVILSVVIGIIILVIMLPYFNELSSSELVINFLSPSFYLLIIALILVVTLFAGVFPAVLITRIKSINILKGRTVAPRISGFQRSLVILQFTASIFLLISVVFVQKQLNYSMNIDLGYRISNIIYFHPYGKFSSGYEAIKEELMRHPLIVDVTVREREPFCAGEMFEIQTDRTDNSIGAQLCFVKENYFDFMNISIEEGSDLSAYNESSNMILISRSLKNLLEMKQYDQTIKMADECLNVKGVVADIKSSSYHVTEPQVYKTIDEVRGSHTMLIKTTNDIEGALEYTGKIWKKINPQRPFEYHFLDQTYEELYNSEKRIKSIIRFGVLVALFITMLGLFAIVKYTMELRYKEVGIRKINGAKVYELMFLLNCRFVNWIAIAFIIACPIAYYAINNWLENFAYKTSMNWWLFILPGLGVLVLALVTMNWQIFVAARRNPIETLNDE
ncbi:MAG: ABC transporter permease [Marinifilaceae bacterium]